MAEKQATKPKKGGIESSNSQRRVIGRPFQKGVSGNPGGRSRASRALDEVFRANAPECERRLLEFSLNEKAPWNVRLEATKECLNRAHGKPKAQAEVVHTHEMDEWSKDQLMSFILTSLTQAGIITVEGELTEEAGAAFPELPSPR
jgi:hypothetical protein